MSVLNDISQFIERLHQHPSCSRFCHDFLDMIQTGMLVVDSRDRQSCEIIWARLRAMKDKCAADPEYASKGNPWESGRRPVSMPMTFQFINAPSKAAEVSSSMDLLRLPSKRSSRGRNRVLRTGCGSI
jgi:hypothetical protein